VWFPWLNHKLDGCADFLLNFYIHKFWDEDNVNTVLHQVALGQRQSFDCLVDGTGSNGLDFCTIVFPDYASDSASYSGGTGGALYFDYVHVYLPPWVEKKGLGWIQLSYLILIVQDYCVQIKRLGRILPGKGIFVTQFLTF
jgi:hypothetical protein